MDLWSGRLPDSYEIDRAKPSTVVRRMVDWLA